jgi:hypothetical protein
LVGLFRRIAGSSSNEYWRGNRLPHDATIVDTRDIKAARGLGLEGGRNLFLGLASRWSASILWVARARKHRGVILNSADNAWVVWPVTNWGFENYTLVVALALTFRFDAVGAGWTLFSTLDTALAAGQATSFGSLAHFGGSRWA